MRALLGLPIPTPLGRWLMLISFTGRKSGKRYRQPVSYVRDATTGTLLTPGGGRWTRNLRDDADVRIRLRGRDFTARPELIEDPDEVGRLLGLMAADNPSINRFVRIPKGSDRHFDPAGLATAIRHGFRIVRWHGDTRF
jgi:deazaflavin-dependent oxidoreductase (nitroreductase family)